LGKRGGEEKGEERGRAMEDFCLGLLADGYSYPNKGSLRFQLPTRLDYHRDNFGCSCGGSCGGSPEAAAALLSKADLQPPPLTPHLR